MMHIWMHLRCFKQTWFKFVLIQVRCNSSSLEVRFNSSSFQFKLVSIQARSIQARFNSKYVLTQVRLNSSSFQLYFEFILFWVNLFRVHATPQVYSIPRIHSLPRGILFREFILIREFVLWREFVLFRLFVLFRVHFVVSVAELVLLCWPTRVAKCYPAGLSRAPFKSDKVFQSLKFDCRSRRGYLTLYFTFTLPKIGWVRKLA